jgi:hypothetical protein
MPINNDLQLYADAWTPTTGVWYHVAVTYDLSAGTARFYKDGVLWSTETGGKTAIYNGTADVNVGRLSSNGQYCDCLLDELGVWSRILTAGEISALYNSGTGIPYSSGTTVNSGFFNFM